MARQKGLSPLPRGQVNLCSAWSVIGMYMGIHGSWRLGGLGRLSLVWLLALAASMAGCSAGSPAGPAIDPEEGQSLFGGAGSARQAGEWTIVLAAFRGQGAEQAAQIALN